MSGGHEPVSHTRPAVGTLLRGWRERRHLSQMELAANAGISTRHLSFVETGKSLPSRPMILLLGEELQLPLRERNDLLLTAGYAPVYSQNPFDAPTLASIRSILGRVLRAHMPYPALVMDRYWNFVEANPAIGVFTQLCAPELLRSPVNALRLALAPNGLAPYIVNFPTVRNHMMERVERQLTLTADPALAELRAELTELTPVDETATPSVPATESMADVVMPFQLDVDGERWSFISTIATFGTPLDVTVAELAVESFFPIDPFTEAQLEQFSVDEIADDTAILRRSRRSVGSG